MTGRQFCSLLLLLALALPAAHAQHEGESHGSSALDVTLLPLLTPTPDDFYSPGDLGATGGFGASGLLDFSAHEKAGVLTPFYRINSSLSVKAHVPLIFSRSVEIGDDEYSAGGIGDITLDVEYARVEPFSMRNSRLRFNGSVKLPTGDDEKDDEGIPVPLGTGSLDFLGRAQYAVALAPADLLCSLLFRKNGAKTNETDYGRTEDFTSGSQLVLSAFGRRNLIGPWGLHLGATFIHMGDGEYAWSDDGGGDGSTDLLQKGNFLDLFPGLSYAIGPINPYFAIRLPVLTSLDNEFADEDRDWSLLFQVSYSPEGLVD